MNNVKRVLATLLMVGLLAGTTGCGAQGNRSGSDFLIVCSFYPVYISTINVAKDVPGVRVINLTPVQTGCLHDYQLTTADMRNLENASVMVINGGGMEAFMDKVIEQKPGMKVIDASQGIDFIRSPASDQINAHVFVSLSGNIQQVRNIGEQLASADPAHADQYRANAAAYIARLEKLDARMHQELDKLPNRNIVTFHEAFPYFAREFNLNIVASVEREPGSQPSAAELAETVQIVRQSGVKVVFVEPQYSAEAAQAIARETGCRVMTLDPAVTGPDNPDAYIDIMTTNLDTLREAMN